MNTKELIESGLLELYCVGATSAEENALVEIMLSEDIGVRLEIYAIQKALEFYAGTYAVQPPGNLYKNLLNRIAQEESDQYNLPPLLSINSKTGDWWYYINQHHIEKPSNEELINMIELIQTPTLLTFIARAKKGAIVEEKHSSEIERVLMLQGSCKFDMNGETFYFKEGDFVEIPLKTFHRAEIISDLDMIFVGQRLVD